MVRSLAFVNGLGERITDHDVESKEGIEKHTAQQELLVDEDKLLANGDDGGKPYKGPKSVLGDYAFLLLLLGGHGWGLDTRQIERGGAGKPPRAGPEHASGAHRQALAHHTRDHVAIMFAGVFRPPYVMIVRNNFEGGPTHFFIGPGITDPNPVRLTVCEVVDEHGP